MRPNVMDFDFASEDTDGFADGLTGAGPWTVADFVRTDGTMPDGLAHQLGFTTVTDESAIDLTIVGTDVMGNAQTEVIALLSSGTAVSVGYYLTLTSITANATLGADVVDIGWVDEVIGATYPISWCSPYACNVHADVTGTTTFTLQQTFANVLAGEAPVWTAISASGSVDLSTQAAVGATAIRLWVESYSAGAEIQVYTSQAERACAVSM